MNQKGSVRSLTQITMTTHKDKLYTMKNSPSKCIGCHEIHGFDGNWMPSNPIDPMLDLIMELDGQMLDTLPLNYICQYLHHFLPLEIL